MYLAVPPQRRTVCIYHSSPQGSVLNWWVNNKSTVLIRTPNLSFCIIIPCVTDFCNSSLPNVVHVFVFVINFCTLKWPKSLSFRGHLNPSARAPETSILVQTGADIESIELSATHLVAAGNPPTPAGARGSASGQRGSPTLTPTPNYYDDYYYY